MIPVRILTLRKLQSPSAAAQNHADAPSLLERHRFGIQLRVFKRLPRGGDRESSGAGQMWPLLRLKIRVRIDAAHFSSNLNGEPGWIKGGNPADSTSRLAISIPQFISRIAQRSQTSKATDNNTIRSPVAAELEGHG